MGKERRINIKKKLKKKMMGRKARKVRKDRNNGEQ